MRAIVLCLWFCSILNSSTTKPPTPPPESLNYIPLPVSRYFLSRSSPSVFNLQLSFVLPSIRHHFANLCPISHNLPLGHTLIHPRAPYFFILDHYHCPIVVSIRGPVSNLLGAIICLSAPPRVTCSREVFVPFILLTNRCRRSLLLFLIPPEVLTAVSVFYGRVPSLSTSPPTKQKSISR